MSRWELISTLQPVTAHSYVCPHHESTIYVSSYYQVLHLYSLDCIFFLRLRHPLQEAPDSKYLSSWVEYKNFELSTRILWWLELSWLQSRVLNSTNVKQCRLSQCCTHVWVFTDETNLFFPHWHSTLIKYLETWVALTCTLRVTASRIPNN
jgi:hypothetical protein